MELGTHVDPLGNFSREQVAARHRVLPNQPIEVTVNTPSLPPSGLCHCCLELTCQKSLWQTYEWMGSFEKYGEMLQECFSLDLSEQQHGKICEVCVTRLRDAVQFRAQVARCRLRLRDMKDFNADKYNIQVTQIKTESQSIKEESEHFNGTDSPEDEDVLYEDELVPPKLEDHNNGVCELKMKHNINDAEETSVKLKKLKTSKETRKGKRTIQIKKGLTVDRRTIAFQSSKFTKPRRNVGLLLEHSTICPFKYSRAYFKCFYCSKNFIVFQELRSHVKESHSKLSYIDIVKCVTRPNDHIKADISDITCRICESNCTSLEEFVAHLNGDHNVTFDKDPVNSIVGYDLGDNKFKCAICKEEFLFFKTLGKHMNEHTSNHVCEVCGKCFLLIERLKAHMQLHSEVAIKCERCPRIFSSKLSMRSHVRYVHERKPYACSICGETFPTYRIRLQHFVERHGRAPLNIKCEHCNKSFRSNSNLNRHVKYTHLNLPIEAKFTCEDCGRKFKCKKVLSDHMLVHSGEKKNECDVCKKKFGRLNSLKEHLKIHRNDKRWSCGVCAVRFIQKCSLKNHIRVHHGEYNIDDLIVYKDPNK